jgi:hypothetical protein
MTATIAKAVIDCKAAVETLHEATKRDGGCAIAGEPITPPL